jgi:hypothetical protein
VLPARGTLVEAAKLPGIVEIFYAITMRLRFAKASLAELLDSARQDPLDASLGVNQVKVPAR